MSTHDAIIVGGGLGGLSCGAHLARKGWKVLVLEKNAQPGGYCVSFQRGDYTFDLMTMLLGVSPGQLNHQLFQELGVADRLEFIKPKHLGRFVYPEHDFRLPNGDLEGVLQVFAGMFPEEQDGLRSLFAHMGRITRDAIRFSRSSAPLLLQMPFFPLLYRHLFPWLTKTTAQLLDRHLRNPRLKALVLATWSWYSVPPSRLNTSYGVFPVFGYWSMGGAVVKGGSGRLPLALADVIRERGGEVRTKTAVAKIRTSSGKAVGVETEAGEFFGAARAVISNVSAVETFGRLVGRELSPPKLLKRMDAMEPSLSAFLVFLGLDEGFAMPDREDYYVQLTGGYDPDEGYRHSCDGDYERAGIGIDLGSNADPSRARGSAASLTLCQFQSFEPWRKYEADYTAGNKELYNREKEKVARRLIERAGQVLPGISKHVKVMEAATPLTMRRYTGNTRGATLGWANIVGQGGPLDRSPRKTPIGNLYLSSAWAFPGEGCVSAALCGYQVARRLAG